MKRECLKDVSIVNHAGYRSESSVIIMFWRLQQREERIMSIEIIESIISTACGFKYESIADGIVSTLIAIQTLSLHIDYCYWSE